MAQLVHDPQEAHHSSQHHTHTHRWPWQDIIGTSAQGLQTGRQGDDTCGQERRWFWAGAMCMKRQAWFGHCCWTPCTAVALTRKQSSIFAIGMAESVLALGIRLQLNPCADAWEGSTQYGTGCVGQ